MPAPPSKSASQTAAMTAEVMAMEQRLAALKTTMAGERERRDAARQRNPTGSVWRSARTDVPTSGQYVSQVLKQKGAPAPKASALGSTSSAFIAGAGGDAGAALADRPLLDPSKAAALAKSAGANGVNGADGGENGGGGNNAVPFGASQGGGGGGGGLGGGTRPLFEWNPSASFANLDGGGDHDYEDLLGPIDADPAPAPPPPPPPAAAGSSTTKHGGGGGSLLHGTFDEDESAASFQEALRAFRGEARPPAAPSVGGGASSTAAASSQAARAPRFVAKPAAAESPTLADKVHCLKAELGLPMEGSMVEAVAAANRIVGFDSLGSLNDQVGRLLRETGIKPVRGAAGGGGGGGSGGGGRCRRRRRRRCTDGRGRWCRIRRGGGCLGRVAALVRRAAAEQPRGHDDADRAAKVVLRALPRAEAEGWRRVTSHIRVCA